MKEIDLSDIHDCPKCHGKIVGIAVDKQGNTYCGYCGQKVDYKPYFEQEMRKWKNANKESKKPSKS